MMALTLMDLGASSVAASLGERRAAFLQGLIVTGLRRTAVLDRPSVHRVPIIEGDDR